MENYSTDHFPPSMPEEAVPPKRSWAWLAWLVILLLVGLLTLGRGLLSKEKPAGEDKLGTALLEVQARYLVGAADIFRPGRDDFSRQAAKYYQGPLGQRLRAIILVGELKNTARAQELLEDLGNLLKAHQPEQTPDQQQCLVILEKLYGDYKQGKMTAPSLTAAERDYLRQSLGWFGELALAPRAAPLPEDQVAAAAGAQAAILVQLWQHPDPEARRQMLGPAHRTLAIVIGVMMAIFLLGSLGLVGLIIFYVFFFSSGLQSSVDSGLGHGRIYAETFAVWLVLFILLHVPLLWLQDEGIDFLGQALAMLLSLLALLWPVLRGLSWRQVRQDIGLTLGPRPTVEPLLGIACYVMSVPMVAIGFVLAFALMFLVGSAGAEAADPFAAPPDYAHPIAEALIQTTWWQRVQLLFLASVVAPLVEETMFRGVLYRHLRETNLKHGWFLSAILSATVVNLLFALLHPQGLVAVPLLMALAYGFAMAREWRDTLVPAMVAHGLSNGLVIGMALLVFGS